tara:strand:+ start:5813 stop:6097 length:285 start_codon:yes stop_codon:yes gene_type:complete
MNGFLKGFLTAVGLMCLFMFLTGSTILSLSKPYNINKPGRYQYSKGVDWRKNNFSTWVDTQNGIALVSYIDSRNVEQVEISNFKDVFELSKNID